ncbi:MAG: efflux transporter outer membrane subunit, partial [Bacteroidales bacterium]
MKRNLIFFTIISVLAVSCGIKNYSPIEFSSKDSLMRDYNSTDTTNIASMPWSTFYTDTTLTALIKEGLQNNMDLKVALYRIEQAAAYYKKSKSDFYPNLSANASASYKGDYQGSKAGQLYNFGISTSWEVDIWGKIRNAKKAKYASLLAQESSKNAIITQLIASIAQSYYALVAYDTQKDLVEETIINRTNYYKTVKALKESAQVNEVAVLQAEAQLCNAQGYIPSINAAIRSTENTICYLLGRVPGPIAREITQNINEIQLTDAPLGVSAQLLHNRPDVLAAEKTVMGYFYNLKATKAAMYPALTISGNTGFDSNALKSWMNITSTAWSIAAGLVQPIFNGRALRTQKEVAYYQYQQSIIEFKSSVLNAGMEVSNAMSQIKSNSELAVYQYKQCIALGKAYEFSIDLLLNGYATYLDVLTAQDGVFNSKLSFITTLQNYS